MFLCVASRIWRGVEQFVAAVTELSPEQLRESRLRVNAFGFQADLACKLVLHI